jgi:hypothetical protein
MLFSEYFKIGCMYLDNFLFWKVWSGAMLGTIFRTVTSLLPRCWGVVSEY